MDPLPRLEQWESTLSNLVQHDIPDFKRRVAALEQGASSSQNKRKRLEDEIEYLRQRYVPINQYKALEQAFNDLTSEYTKLSAAHEATVEKWRHEKERIKAWHTWHEERSRKRKRKKGREPEKGLGDLGPSGDSKRLPPNDAPPEKHSSKLLLDTTHNASLEPTSTGSSTPDESTLHNQQELPSLSSDSDSRPTSSSSSTISQNGHFLSASKSLAGESVTLGAQSVQEIPVVYMETEESLHSMTERSESTVKIKTEIESSLGDSIPAFPVTGGGESLDLDECGPRIKTPKKLRDFTRKNGTKVPWPSQDPSSQHSPQRLNLCATDSEKTENGLRPISPSMEPFRALPLRRLGLNHFKVNPGYNQGLDFAFTETVRNREQRKCLSGCTKPECCGDQFRRILEIGGIPTPPRSALQWRSQDEEHEILAGHLGQERAQIRPLERQEEVLQARTKKMADQVGRHRYTYERAKTPPGFWRAGMPSTQELDEDKKEAFELERKKVEERYREAMRLGGKWLFKDE